MAEHTFLLRLVTPQKLLLEAEVSYIQVPGSEGYLGVLAHHAPLLTSLEPGVMSVRKPDGQQEHFVVTGGFLEVSDNRATVLADSAVPEGAPAPTP